MKVLVELASKNISQYVNKCDALLLGLEDFSVMNTVTFSLEEVKSIISSYPQFEIFIKMDKNIFNEELDALNGILKELDRLKVAGVFFYDLSLLKIKKDLKLELNLVWAQTHMVTNYRTCNYYYSQGVNYALLSKEITLDEVLEIKKKSLITPIVEVISLPSVAFSRRKLVHNYYEDMGETASSTLNVLEKITGKNYIIKEEKAGTGFFLDEALNGTCIISNLYQAGIDYILLREDGIKDFLELVDDTKKYISSGCCDDNYVLKYKKLGDSTGFFFKKTIYRVNK